MNNLEHSVTKTIQSYIYKSPKKDELYLFLCKKDDFESLPEGLMKSFGQPQYVMELELNPERPLARSDVNEVIANLDSQGFHLQMPPADPRLSVEAQIKTMEPGQEV